MCFASLFTLFIEFLHFYQVPSHPALIEKSQWKMKNSGPLNSKFISFLDR